MEPKPQDGCGSGDVPLHLMTASPLMKLLKIKPMAWISNGILDMLAVSLIFAKLWCAVFHTYEETYLGYALFSRPQV